MSLAYGRPYLAIPGPSALPDRVLQAMHQPAPNIYEGALPEMVETIFPDLKTVARTRGEVAIYIANGHGAWEAALANVLSRGDKVLVLSTGHFAKGWGNVAANLGAQIEVMEFGLRGPVDPVRVAERLREDTAHDIKAILCVQVDTATSVRNDVPAIRAAIDEAGHPALFLLDCIACLACDDLRMDDWGVDVMVAGSQKGLMTPPGLGFVYFNEKASQARAKADCVTAYWDWLPRTQADIFYQYFFGTAPTHHLFGLREALNMLVHEEGIDAALARHGVLARAVWAAFDGWATEGGVSLNIVDPAYRSHAVTALRCAAPHGAQLRSWMEQEAGVTLGIGLGMAAPGSPEAAGFFRIGHMGHVNPHMVLGVLTSLQAGMDALDVPYAPGGLDAAARVVADATRRSKEVSA
ncbi:pyridoxal-phosphate-dependent aminotransferase family protein [Meridianimarinicoccus aquatilis]|uniref:Alanine--glyoxylate aminotransferase family protein n=1 Tax=Meridianimarinicoccus aquatilis TaxID=2552766 RepID=A0A4V6PPG0_9RHOB|nr:aminotransferase class V-fold PLP-dependent enzyme [Fluviibacterium aquatile]TDL89039.1 alanine--glyoxylate aminotransferase family protein [Fluviibacterium aquatile]